MCAVCNAFDDTLIYCGDIPSFKVGKIPLPWVWHLSCVVVVRVVARLCVLCYRVCLVCVGVSVCMYLSAGLGSWVVVCLWLS